MDPSTCVVLLPVHGNLAPRTEEGVWELARRGYAVRFLRDSSDIALARSQMATDAMAAGFTETMWIDADVEFHPDHVERLRSHGLPLVAGLYPRKGRPQFAAQFKAGTVGLTLGVGGGLVEMDYVGMGFTLVRRQVYTARYHGRLPPTVGGGYDGNRVIPFFLPVVTESKCGDPTYLAEDKAFCYRAREDGIAVMADTAVKLGHVGSYAWTWDDFLPRARYDTLTVTNGFPNDTTPGGGNGRCDPTAGQTNGPNRAGPGGGGGLSVSARAAHPVTG